MRDVYDVRPAGGPVNIDVCVPGSKSMTNRALLLAALADGESILRGVGLSDDSRVFMEALTTLGFDLTESYGADGSITVRVPGHGGELPAKSGRVYVGSAGTAARFLTAMMGLSDGSYEVTSSDQMKKRPMRELLEALEQMGARFEYQEEPYAFPFKVFGRRYGSTDAENESGREHKVATDKPLPDEIPLNIDRSSQFLSALLLCAPMVPEGYSIHLTGIREARSYVVISEHMMSQFGYQSDRSQRARNVYRIPPNQTYHARDYLIEPDVSAACYFYAMAAANGGSARVAGVNRENTQGDMRFLDVLEQMGCVVCETESGDILVTHDLSGSLHGITVNMSDFSDQTMTLAAIAPFADSPTTITGVAHIRGQESNRIEAVVTELTRLGVHCEEHEDGMTIWPLAAKRQPETEQPAVAPDLHTENTGEKPILIHTYNDHRMAMAFAVTGTRLPGITIDNPSCCRKTFENYFEILDSL